MTKAYLKTYLRKVCNHYGVQVRFVSNKMKVKGYYEFGSNKITVSTKGRNTEIASVVMHELAHALNCRDNKYPLYHKKDYYRLSSKMKSRFLATAHRAEMFTDMRGRLLFKHYFGGNDFYVPGYENTPESKANLREVIINAYAY